MKKRQKVLLQKTISLFTGFLLVFQSLTSGFFISSKVSAQDATVTEAPTPIPVTTPEPQPTDEITTPTLVPTEITTPTPTEELTPTIIPTDTATPTPTEYTTPTIEPTTEPTVDTPTEEPKNNSPPTNKKSGEILTGVSTTIASTQPPATPTVTAIPSETGEIQATILKNVQSQTLDIDGVNPDGSAKLTTDKADYAPTDTAIISGKDFSPNTTYELTISSSDNPATSTTVSVSTNENGEFIYAYQLDGNYRPNYTVAISNNRQIITATTFTDGFKIDICHSTGSTSNPYTNPEVSINSLDDCINVGGHGSDINDIIPPFTFSYRGSTCSYPGQNITSYNQAFLDNGCSSPADLKVTKTNDLNGGNAILDQNFTWSIKIQNIGSGDAKFNENETIFKDNLPNSNVIYGTPTIATHNNIDNDEHIICSRTGYDITCKVENNHDVTIHANGYFIITVTAKFSIENTYINPRTDGLCRVDPNSTIPDPDRTNNDCTNSVTVGNQSPTTGTLTVIKHVDNTGGGTKQATDFQLTVSGTSNPNPSTFSGMESPGQAVTLQAGSYNVTEGSHTGYTVSYVGCSGTFSPTAPTTCTVTNTYIPVCGDGTPYGREQCDDGNTTNGDGCSATCTIESGTINGYKYDDADGNTSTVGDQTAVSGWGVTLYQCVDSWTPATCTTIVSSTTTDTNGHYAFTNLYDHMYRVVEESRTNWQTLSPTNGIMDVNLGAGATATVNFINTRLGSISGYKYEDQNGTIDTENTDTNPVSNWSISLWRLIGNTWTHQSDTTTGTSGQYSFTGLLPGNYQVREAAQTNWTNLLPTTIDVAITSGMNSTDKNFLNTYVEETDKRVTLCHATEGNHEFNQITVSTSGAYHGHIAHEDVNDIIPPFVYNDTTYSQNWEGNTLNQDTWENGCVVPTGTIHGFKWNDLDGNHEMNGDESVLSGWTINLYKYNGETYDFVASMQTADSTSPHFGWYWFEHLMNGQYKVCEQAQTGWTQTFPQNQTGNCYVINLPDGNSYGFPEGLNYVSGPEYNFGNQYASPELQLSKTNNATGDQTPGSIVTYTLKVKALNNNAYNVKVIDLVPQGFVFTGDWTATINGNPMTIGAPTYHSPGTWSLGNLQKDDEIILTMTTKIADSQKPGLYKDLALAYGCQTNTDIFCSDVTATAVGEGQLNTTFVGTQVNIVKEQQDDKTLTVTHEETGSVLGATTELPSTGADAKWVVIAMSLIITGLGAIVISSKMRRYHA